MAPRLSPRDLLERLVAFRSISQDSNLDLVEFVADYLAGLGIAANVVPDASGRKAQIYAQVGPDAPGGVVLSGHSDVVPVAGQDWTSDPWLLTERDGRLYGRGTCDMKGFDALALWAMALAAERGVRRPLQFALSQDEELGCIGAPRMIAHMLSHGMTRAETVIVGEPSMMKVVTGHKGGTGFAAMVTGFEVHSSLIHQGVNAIMSGARLIDWANKMNAENLAASPGPLAAAFVPPCSTLHVGTISGGTAQNITAAECRFGFDIRVVPGESMADWEARLHAEAARISAEMLAVRPGTGISLRPTFTVPPLVPETDGKAERLARLLTGDNAQHVVSYGTEAGQFQERGYSVVVCGPGDIAQAHQPDEFLSLAQLQAGQDFMEGLVDWLAA